jgi:hypothetical protein
MLISFETPAHGTYQVPASLVDETVERFWFRSVDEVRSIVEGWAGHSFADVHSKLALCIIYADFDAALRANVADRVLAQVEPEPEPGWTGGPHATVAAAVTEDLSQREQCIRCGMVANVVPIEHESRYGHVPAVRRGGQTFDYSPITGGFTDVWGELETERLKRGAQS